MPESVVQRLRLQAGASPDAAALRWRKSRWTYGQLWRGAMAVATQLRARGIQPAQRVGLLFRSSPQYVASYYGVLAAGCVAVPLNALERAPVWDRQLQHCDCPLVLCEASHPEIAALRMLLEARGVALVPITANDGPTAADDWIELMHSGDDAPEDTLPASQGLALIIYTSGTTGQPKGVMLSHANLTANITAICSYLHLSRDDRTLCVLPFHFSYGNSVLQTHLWVGAEIVIEDNLAFPQLTLQALQAVRATGFSGVPSTFALLLGRCNMAEYDLGALRYVTQAGGAMPQALIGRLRAQLPHAKLYIMYGQTEATSRLTYLEPDQLAARPGSVGRPLQGIEIEVRDAAGRRLASGEIGEICARGPNVMMGYWQNDSATAEVLRDGWLHTGDTGHFDGDGYLYIDGRSVEMIKVGAFRVSPLEVEEVVARLPEVIEVAAVGVADELLGQAIKVVLVTRPDSTLTVQAVRAHCRAHLASYKVPKVVEFTDVLPRTTSGKVQRYKLS